MDTANFINLLKTRWDRNNCQRESSTDIHACAIKDVHDMFGGYTHANFVPVSHDDLDVLLDKPETTVVLRKNISKITSGREPALEAFSLALFLGLLDGYERLIELGTLGDYELSFLLDGGCTLLYDAKKASEDNIYDNTDVFKAKKFLYWEKYSKIFDVYDFDAVKNYHENLVRYNKEFPQDKIEYITATNWYNKYVQHAKNVTNKVLYRYLTYDSRTIDSLSNTNRDWYSIIDNTIFFNNVIFTEDEREFIKEIVAQKYLKPSNIYGVQHIYHQVKDQSQFVDQYNKLDAKIEAIELIWNNCIPISKDSNFIDKTKNKVNFDLDIKPIIDEINRYGVEQHPENFQKLINFIAEHSGAKCLFDAYADGIQIEDLVELPVCSDSNISVP